MVDVLRPFTISQAEPLHSIVSLLLVGMVCGLETGASLVPVRQPATLITLSADWNVRAGDEIEFFTLSPSTQARNLIYLECEQ